MNTIIQKRCFNHAHREAAAVCPECKRFFCRECVTEHDDRVVCSSCLNTFIDRSSCRGSHFAGLLKFSQSLLGFFTMWLFFYYLGQILISIPFSFHEGTVWQTGWWAE